MDAAKINVCSTHGPSCSAPRDSIVDLGYALAAFFHLTASAPPAETTNSPNHYLFKDLVIYIT